MENPNFFPEILHPDSLRVFKSNDMTWEKRVFYTCLQGLVNREKPQIYQVTAACDDHWLKFYEEEYDVEYSYVEQPIELLKRYGRKTKGLVIYDPNLPDTANLAITISGLYDLLPATENLAVEMEDQDLVWKQDLRGRFSDRISAYKWARDELLPQCNRHILGSLCVGKQDIWIQNRTPVIDYLVANKSLVIHLSAARRDREEAKLFDNILESAGPRGVILGWHCARDKEKEYVARAAQKGFFVLCSSGAPNLTVHGGLSLRRKHYRQREARAKDRIEEKVYIAPYLTDGDALWAMNNLQTDNWISKRRGEIPFNWGLLPLIHEMAPGMLEYYYQTSTENDYFACPSSGAGYTYSFLHDDWYLGMSKKYLDATGQQVANMVNWDTRFWWREVEEPRAIFREKRILKPLGLVCGLGGSMLARSYPLGIPKVHASLVLHASEDCGKKIRDTISRIPDRPLFLFAFVQIERGVFDHLVEDLESLPPEVEIMNLDTFMMTLRKAVKEGKVGEDLYTSRDNESEILKSEGRKNRKAAAKLLVRLVDILDLPRDEMAHELTVGNWINLSSHDPSAVIEDTDSWRRRMEGHQPFDTTCLADALGYNLFYTVWAYMRARLNEVGRYSNHMDSCLTQYLDLFPDSQNGVLEEIWEMWHAWNRNPPELDHVVDLTRRSLNLVESSD